MAEEMEVVEATLPGGEVILVRAVQLGGDTDVGYGGLPSFKDVSDTIKSIAYEINKALEAVAPKKATVEFGLEVAVKAGKLTALLVEGAGKATLKITLEWGG